MNQEELMPRLNVNEYVPPSTQAEWQTDPMTNRLTRRVQEVQDSAARTDESLRRQGEQLMADMRLRTGM